MRSGSGGEMRIGVDIGGSSIGAVLVAAGGAVVGERTAPTPQGVPIVAAVVEVIRTLLAAAPSGAVRAAGIGVPGIVDPETGRVSEALNLGVRELALGPLVASATDLVVRVDNDVKATALGAAAVLGTGPRALSYLNIGTGVAAAAIERGVIVRGGANAAGEIGHLVVRDDGPSCTCGGRGCVEAYVGGRALSGRLSALLPSATVTGLFAEPAPSPAILAERRAAARAVAAAVRALGLLYGSETIVLGGGVIRHARGLVEATAALLRADAEASTLFAALGLHERLVVIPAEVPVAALGAAALAAGEEGNR